MFKVSWYDISLTMLNKLTEHEHRQKFDIHLELH